MNRVVHEVAEYLGSTSAVARSAYIDPRIIELYEPGVPIAGELTRLGAEADFGQLATQGTVEDAVRRLLGRRG